VYGYDGDPVGRPTPRRADAYKFVEELRWPDGIAVCPHCDHRGATYIEPTNGEPRHPDGRSLERRVWRCAKTCRKQFSAITGTCMHGSKVPVRMWVLCFFEMCSSKNGVAAREIERKYGVCCRTAWHLMHRIREAMKRDGLAQSMRGFVVADETWIGGQPKYKKGHQSGQGGQGKTDKTPVLTLIDAERGEARSVVIPDVTAATLRKAIAEQVDMANTTLREVAVQVLDGHPMVGAVEMTDEARMRKLFGQVDGKRLTYKRVKAA
jgi:hypothetical protein